MKSERATLDILFPKVRAEILRLLFSSPPKQRYVRELMNLSGLALGTAQDELRKLSAVGLIKSWSNNYHRFYRANRNHPLYRQLVRLVELSARLPRTKHSALVRPRPSIHRKNRRRKRRPLPPDRPVRWDIFARER